MSTDKLTSILVEDQFPQFAREDGANIVAFIKKYYESQEDTDGYINVVKNLLAYQDIDTSPDNYLEYIAREIIPHIPKRLLADKVLLSKHIQDCYMARGSAIGYKILFRVLFDEEIEIYIPGEDMLRASDGRWVEEVAVKINNFVGTDPYILTGNIITGLTSNATAIVDRVIPVISRGATDFYLYLQNAVGTFQVGEAVQNIDASISFTIINASIGPLENVIITDDGGALHEVRDNLSFSSIGGGFGATGTVLQTRDDSAVEFYVANGGAGYAVDLSLLSYSVVGGGGSDASFIITELKPPWQNISIFDDFIYMLSDVPINNGANNNFAYLINNCHFSSTNDFITFDNNRDHGFVDDITVGFYYISGNTSNIGITPATSYYVISANTTAFQISTSKEGDPVTLLTNGDGNATQVSADLALANVESILGSSLNSNLVNTGVISTISTTDHGFGYYNSTPIGHVGNSLHAAQLIPDLVNGGFLGDNASILSNYLPGTIQKLEVILKGANYTANESITITNTSRLGTIAPPATALLSSIVTGGDIISPIIYFDGTYTDTKGWLSWDKYLQDNYYYQEFSYEIRSAQEFLSYTDDVKNILHPAGTKMFGQTNLYDTNIFEITDNNEIAVWNEILDSNVYVTFTQSNTAAADVMTTNSSAFSSIAANDTLTISNSYNANGVYIVTSIVDANTITVTDTDSYVKLSPTKETISGYEFTANNILIFNSTWDNNNSAGDDIYVRNAVNENNEGGPFTVTAANSTHLEVQGTAVFTPSANDTSATIEIRRSFAFNSNTTLSLINVKFDRYVNTLL